MTGYLNQYADTLVIKTISLDDVIISLVTLYIYYRETSGGLVDDYIWSMFEDETFGLISSHEDDEVKDNVYEDIYTLSSKCVYEFNRMYENTYLYLEHILRPILSEIEETSCLYPTDIYVTEGTQNVIIIMELC